MGIPVSNGIQTNKLRERESLGDHKLSERKKYWAVDLKENLDGGKKEHERETGKGV